VFSVGAVLMTPDAPLALAWVGTLWAFERALRLGPRWLLAAGAFLGVAALSKLTAGLLAVALLAALLLSTDGRRSLSTPWPWLGAALTLALASPMLLWNAAYGWPSLAFQAQHGLRGRSFSLVRLWQSVGAQALYVSPILLVLAAAEALRPLRRGSGAAALGLGLSALPVVGFFTVAAAMTPGALPHWPAPGWLSALLLLAPAAADYSSGALRWLRRGVVLGLVTVAALLALVLLPLSCLPRSPLEELEGWREGALAAQAAAAGRRLAATHWIAYGELSWYTGTEVAYLGDRTSAPSYYQRPPAPGEPLLLVVVEGLGPGREALEARVGRLEPAGDFTAARGGRPVRRYTFWSTHPGGRP
jgi:4-amino-4-deoxy-L-arabinose transferase-like glycosyltransferase